MQMQTLNSMSKYGDESKIAALAKQDEVSFDDFAAAFHKTGPVRASLKPRPRCWPNEVSQLSICS
jgi:hypothetical protein